MPALRSWSPKPLSEKLDSNAPEGVETEPSIVTLAPGASLRASAIEITRSACPVVVGVAISPINVTSRPRGNHVARGGLEERKMEERKMEKRKKRVIGDTVPFLGSNEDGLPFALCIANARN